MPGVPVLVPATQPPPCTNKITGDGPAGFHGKYTSIFRSTPSLVQ